MSTQAVAAAPVVPQSVPAAAVVTTAAKVTNPPKSPSQRGTRAARGLGIYHKSRKIRKIRKLPCPFSLRKKGAGRLVDGYFYRLIKSREKRAASLSATIVMTTC